MVTIFLNSAKFFNFACITPKKPCAVLFCTKCKHELLNTRKDKLKYIIHYNVKRSTPSQTYIHFVG